MKGAAIGFALGAIVLLAPTLAYFFGHPESRRAAKFYLMPGAAFLGLAAIFAVVWLAGQQPG